MRKEEKGILLGKSFCLSFCSPSVCCRRQISAYPCPVVATSEKRYRQGGNRRSEKTKRREKNPPPFSGILYTKKLCAVVLSCTFLLLQSFSRNPTEIKKKSAKKRKGRRTEVSLPFQEVTQLIQKTQSYEQQPKYRTGLRPARLYYCKGKSGIQPEYGRKRKNEKQKKDEKGCPPLCLSSVSSISRLRFASLC